MGVMLFLAVAISISASDRQRYMAERRLAELEKEIQYYEAMNEALLEQAETLRSDEYIEKTARESRPRKAG